MLVYALYLHTSITCTAHVGSNVTSYSCLFVHTSKTVSYQNPVRGGDQKPVTGPVVGISESLRTKDLIFLSVDFLLRFTEKG